jgi:transglutaminase-like putative cysteine protease
MLGLPARYVSGYLLTRPAAGDPGAGARAGLLGADASHAWVQVWCPGTPGVPAEGPSAGWLDLDPTNDLVPGSSHVRLAVGRDFGDVTPLRGVIRAGGRHTLTVGVRTRVLGPASGADGAGVLVATVG